MMMITRLRVLPRGTVRHDGLECELLCESICYGGNRCRYGKVPLERAGARVTQMRTKPPVWRVMQAIIGLALLGIAAVPTAVWADPVDDYVIAKMTQKSIPGLVLAVIRDGRVIKQKAFGYANLELKVPATLDTSFPLASTTKIFTAVALMQLVEQNKITLDESVNKIVPDLPATWAKVTVRHCLSHTTGLPFAIDDEINAAAIEGDRDQLIAKLAGQPMTEPGTRTDYNTTDYVLLTMVIEKVSGLSYEDYIQRFVLNPAGIKTARFGDAWSIIPGRADLYTNLAITPDHNRLLVRNGQPVPLKTGILHYGHKVWPEYMQSAAGLNGSIHDLIDWEAALDAGKVIKAESLAELEKPFKMADGKDAFFGLGFIAHPIAGPGSVSYGGGAAVWRVKVPSQHLIVIVLTNLQGAQPESFIANIIALYATDTR
jgi:CubicO group peptidase (beta-lactamase class C family)